MQQVGGISCNVRGRLSATLDHESLYYKRSCYTYKKEAAENDETTRQRQIPLAATKSCVTRRGGVKEQRR